MKNIKLLIVANNDCQNWQSWPEKISTLQNWFFSKINLLVDKKNVNFVSVPFSRYSADDYKNLKNLQGIDPIWYDTNISPMGKGYDIILFVVPVKQWLDKNDARGWRNDRTYGAVELQIASDENERFIWFGEDQGDMFHNLARHEILHALYMLSGQTDNVHYWWNKDPRLLTKCLEEINFIEKFSLEKMLEAVRRLLVSFSIMQPNTPSEELVKIATDKNHLNKDFTNDDFVSDEVSCVYALTTILNEQDKRVPIMTYTPDLYKFLKNSVIFQEVHQPIEKMEAGYIVISVTGTGNGKLSNGHCGLYVNENDIMSNSSQSGLWSKNYTRNSWRERYYNKGGFPIYIFKKII